MSHEPPRIGELFPELTGELVDLLHAEGENDLAASVPFLRLTQWCECQDSFCKSFYTAPPPQGKYGPHHRCVALLPDSGMIILDVVLGEIQYVEILDRPSLS
ncbi:hypothetical protein BJF79_01415 [Actinomadura sp. CNU-125]|uniref:hypothetical protein n=1 Tax=Actinomadura sp. CNU-125 TaxID=1904961 RepID=UPI00095A895E|nr:hypothetical protein [Actinomadura sp. CNU-125]OLT27297.1 hypothetical protein BJF79_01415 [Actinomadura sp. CNU-125]